MLNIIKNCGLEPGPGHYDPLNDLISRLKSRPCIKIVKPLIVDEHLYEIVNGTSRVLQPAYMHKKLWHSYEKMRLGSAYRT